MAKKEVTTTDLEKLRARVSGELDLRRTQMGQMIHRIWWLKDELKRIDGIQSAPKELENG